MSSQYPVDGYYDRCMYKNCKNMKFLHGKRLFRFPMRKDTRCDIWIRNTGNMNLKKLSGNTLRKLGLCEDHFFSTSFTNTTKNRLKRDAIPIPYENKSLSINDQNVETDKTSKDNCLPVSSLNHRNLILEEHTYAQMPEEFAVQTHKCIYFNYDTYKIEGDDMVYFDPCIYQDIEYEDDNIKKNDKDNDSNNKEYNDSNNKEYNDSNNKEYNDPNEKESNDPNEKIKILRMENFNLRQKIRRLESQIDIMIQKCKCKNLDEYKQ